MLKKDVEIKWIDQERSSFKDIKKAINMEAPTLISPDYTKSFYIFSFASYDIVAAVLLQKDDEGLDHPITFFSKNLRDAEIKSGLCSHHIIEDLQDLHSPCKISCLCPFGCCEGCFDSA